MGVPKQALEQLEQAEKMQAEMLGASGGEEPHENSSQQQEGDTQQEEAGQQEHAGDSTPPQADNNADDADYAASAQDAEIPEDASSGQEHDTGYDDNRIAKLEQQYRVLKGKYDAEVPRQQNEIRQLQGYNNSLLQELATLRQGQAKPPEAETPPASGDFDVKRYVPKDIDVEDYGEDFLQVQGKIAKGIVDESLQKIQEDRARDRYVVFGDRLRAAVPNLDEVNNDAEFVRWLNQTSDGYSGLKLMDTLHLAEDHFDHETVAKIFNEWNAKKQNAGQHDSQPAERFKKKSLESQVAPRKQSSAPPKKQPESYSPHDLLDKSKQYTQGKISLKSYKAFEQKFNEAQREGRIRPS